MCVCAGSMCSLPYIFINDTVRVTINNCGLTGLEAVIMLGMSQPHLLLQLPRTLIICIIIHCAYTKETTVQSVLPEPEKLTHCSCFIGVNQTSLSVEDVSLPCVIDTICFSHARPGMHA